MECVARNEIYEHEPPPPPPLSALPLPPWNFSITCLPKIGISEISQQTHNPKQSHPSLYRTKPEMQQQSIYNPLPSCNRHLTNYESPTAQSIYNPLPSTVYARPEPLQARNILLVVCCIRFTSSPSRAPKFVWCIGCPSKCPSFLLHMVGN